MQIERFVSGIFAGLDEYLPNSRIICCKDSFSAKIEKAQKD
jgi:hypothetical protein